MDSNDLIEANLIGQNPRNLHLLKHPHSPANMGQIHQKRVLLEKHGEAKAVWNPHLDHLPGCAAKLLWNLPSKTSMGIIPNSRKPATSATRFDDIENMQQFLASNHLMLILKPLPTTYFRQHVENLNCCFNQESLDLMLKPKITGNHYQHLMLTPQCWNLKLLASTSLVGGFNPSENMKVSWDDYSHILWKIKNVWNHQPVIDYYINHNLPMVFPCSKPPTSLFLW